MYKNELHYNNFSTINEKYYKPLKSLLSLFVFCTQDWIKLGEKTGNFIVCHELLAAASCVLLVQINEILKKGMHLLCDMNDVYF